jgi:ABC exporter DevB family membrane fusion protein
MKKIPWWIVASAGVGAVLVVTVAQQVAAGPQTVPTSKDMAASERVAVPKDGRDERTVLPTGAFVAGNGIIEPTDRETKVASQVPGRLKVILIKEGEIVAKGAALAELDNANEEAQLAAAEGDLAVARAELTRTLRGLRREDIDAIVADTESLKARAKLSQETLARTEQLSKGGAATPDELDRARRQAESDARALDAQEARRRAALAGSRAEDILVAQAKVQAALGRRDQARAQLQRTIIAAPIAGEILQVKVRAGEYVTPGGAEPVAVMGDTAKLRVRMDVDERDVGKVKVGATAFVRLDAFPDRRVPGKVVEVGRRMGRKNVRTDDPTERIDTKILEVVLELDDKKDLVPGLRVIAYVETPAP